VGGLGRVRSHSPARRSTTACTALRRRRTAHWICSRSRRTRRSRTGPRPRTRR
jgi:hypothetical protein